MTAPAFPTGTILGYPRIGRRRELKHAVEAFWAGRIDSAELERTAAGLRAATRERLAGLGLGRTDSAIPESFSYYDQVLDAAVAVGAIPARFERLLGEDGRLDLAGYFTVARGEGADAPLEMTKWFDSNYHYLVPEIGPDTAFTAHADALVAQVREAREAGFVTRPVLVGPVTFLLLAKAADGAPEGFRPIDRLADLVPVYRTLLAELATAGAEWVQLDEPGLVSESLDEPRERVLEAVAEAYDALGAVDARPAIFVAAPYGDLAEALPVLAATPVEAIGFDLVRGDVPAQLDPVTEEALAAKTLVAGVVDGHNIWRGDLAHAFARAEALRSVSGSVAVSTSTSLLHVPHDVDEERALDARLVSWLAFADQKVAQVAVLARGLAEGRDAIAADLDAASAALADR
ncbi:5-methyltetrahydropteroyltriglutamate--homocysteine S-methyltransferase, partial [Agromyces binzhouensis]